jgi:hypothetical protein
MKWLSCREVLERESKRRDSGVEPSFMDRIGILFHMALCRTCRIYIGQVEAIRTVVRKMAGRADFMDASLSEDRKRRIRESLEREIKSCCCTQKDQAKKE